MDTKTTSPQNREPLYVPRRPLYSLSNAANVCGLSPKMLKSAIENGDVPGVRILHLGPSKLAFVRSRPFIAWLEGYPAPPDLGPAADAVAEQAVAESFDPVEYQDDLFN